MNNPECPVKKRRSRDPRLDAMGVPIEGAISHEDGLMLYDLACIFNAKRIVELGTFAGHGTNYLAAAAVRTGGRVDTVDIFWFRGGVLRGQAIEWRFRRVIRQHWGKAYDWLWKQPDDSIDFIFEDTDHSYGNTLALIALSRRKLKSGGILAVHDVAVKGVSGCRVADAVADSGLDFEIIDLAPAHNGLAIWRKP